MSGRRSIKCGESIFEMLNTDRKNRDLTWDTYLERLYESEFDSIETTIEIDEQEVAERIIEEVVQARAGNGDSGKEEPLWEVHLDTEELAKDIAAYSSGSDHDVDRLADIVAERVSQDVRDTLRQVVAR